VILMSEAVSWRTETAPYLAEIKEWQRAIDRSTDRIGSLKLMAPLHSEPTMRERLAINLLLFPINALRIIAELDRAVLDEWASGRFVAACLNLRLIFELWAAISFAADLADRLYVTEEPLDELESSVSRLVAGARHPVRLPWGGVTEVQAINIQTMVEKLDRRWTDALAAYGLLSAGSHPCYHQLGYLHMMGNAGDNWSNEVFAEHAHELLTRFVAIGSRCMVGLVADVERLCLAAAPLCARFLDCEGEVGASCP
jgi:hypothetical protein